MGEIYLQSKKSAGISIRQSIKRTVALIKATRLGVSYPCCSNIAYGSIFWYIAPKIYDMYAAIGG